MTIESRPRRDPTFLWLFLGKVILLIVTIVVVYSLYAYLHAYRLDWLGWFYVKLLPLTNGLYGLVETYFPDDVKYKIRGAITDDLGQRSLAYEIRDGNSAEALGGVLPGVHRSANHRAEQAQPPGQAFRRLLRDPFAHQRTPRERRRDRC